MRNVAVERGVEPDDLSVGGAAPGQGAKLLAMAGLLGAATKLVETGLRLWSGTAQAATYVGTSTIAYVGMNLSPALVSVGYIVGLNIAVLVFVGGSISWFVAIPLYSAVYLDADPALAAQFAGLLTISHCQRAALRTLRLRGRSALRLARSPLVHLRGHQRLDHLAAAANRAEHLAAFGLLGEAGAVRKPSLEDMVAAAFEIEDNHNDPKILSSARRVSERHFRQKLRSDDSPGKQIG